MGNISGRGKEGGEIEDDFEEGGSRREPSKCGYFNPFDVDLPKISENQVFNLCSTDRTNEFRNYGILPLNTLHKIFLYTSIGDIFNIMRTCKLCYHICNTNLFWKERLRNFYESSEYVADKEGASMNWKKVYHDEFSSFQRYNDEFKDLMIHDKDGNSFEILAKYLIIGDVSVGKSSLLRRFSEEPFPKEYLSTIGVDFKIRGIRAGRRIVKLQIWDTAGQERFRKITNSYYRGSHVILLCFALDDEKSFQNLNQWYKDLKDYGEENVVVIVVGTKSDCSKQHGKRKVSRADVQKKMKEELFPEGGEDFDMRYQYCECSAKDNYCCVLPFGLGLRAYFKGLMLSGDYFREDRNVMK